MLSQTALLIATLVVAQPADGPKLARGQELIYRGNYSETARGEGAAFQKTYDLESRVFVREAGPQEFALAFCTLLKTPSSETPGATRFELATVNRQGRVRLANGRPPPLDPDGPPAAECAGFVERPAGNPDSWIDHGTQPPISWRVIGFEQVHGVRCLELFGEQESDWDRPAVHRPGWRRMETVWVGTSTGIVERLQRDLQCRRVGAGDTTTRSLTTYELQGGISTFPGPLGDDRQLEIKQAALFQRELRGLQNNRAATPAAYAKLVGRIDLYADATPATPFRAAIHSVRVQAEAGRKGEPPPPAGP
jgi:hypothetical protein